MLKLHNLTIRNFLSCGNATQTINFNREELVLVLGENLDLGGDSEGSRNGSGKTVLINAVSYALFSWPISNIKKEHLVNITNEKNMLVTLDFESNDKSYRVVRGLKPRILEFYENGKKFTDIEIDKEKSETVDDSAQGDNRETQREIDKAIGMTHDMFCQIVAINTYTQPFLFQKNIDQKNIIEQLLGITLLSEKAEQLKEEIKIARDSLTKEDARIKASETANKRIQSQIDSLKLKQKAWANQKIENLKKLDLSIQKLSKIDIDKELLLHSEWDTYNDAEKDRSNLKQQHAQMSLAYNKEEKIILQLEDDLKILQEQCCQTCKQKLQTDKHSELLLEVQKQYNDSKNEISIIKESMEVLMSELILIPILNKPEERNYKSIDDAHNHRNKLMLLNQEYTQKQNEIDPYQSQIESMLGNAIEIIDMSELNALSRFIDHQEFLQKLLTNKDSFIRKKIIEQNLSYLNTRLKYYLILLGLPHEVVFQNDLSVEISELGRELSSGNLSRGEMARLSLGLSFSFRDVYESLFQNINILLIDESLDSGVDSGGTEAAAKLLRDMGREQHKDVWLISHKDELISKCPTICKVTKENGFTSFSFIE
jgi:DNA repair exonuclease SbcCD ATPase subunit